MDILKEIIRSVGFGNSLCGLQLINKSFHEKFSKMWNQSLKNFNQINLAFLTDGGSCFQTMGLTSSSESKFFTGLRCGIPFYRDVLFDSLLHTWMAWISHTAPLEMTLVLYDGKYGRSFRNELFSAKSLHIQLKYRTEIFVVITIENLDKNGKGWFSEKRIVKSGHWEWMKKYQVKWNVTTKKQYFPIHIFSDFVSDWLKNESTQLAFCPSVDFCGHYYRPQCPQRKVLHLGSSEKDRILCQGCDTDPKPIVYSSSGCFHYPHYPQS